MFDRVLIIGVGLIGGSLGLAFKQNKLAKHIVGYGRGQENLQTALALGCIDRIATDLQGSVIDADLVVIATPVGQFASVLETIAPQLTPQTIVTDVLSVKVSAIEQAQAILPYPEQFIGGHPIAGTENSGAQAAQVDLFANRRWILTPTQQTVPQHLQRLEHALKAISAHVEYMSAQTHDEIFAWVSHLPHLLAFGLAKAIEQHNPQMLYLGGGGLRDFLRIAASDPTMWRDIFAANQANLIMALKSMQAVTQELLALVEDPISLEQDLYRIQKQVQTFRGSEKK